MHHLIHNILISALAALVLVQVPLMTSSSPLAQTAADEKVPDSLPQPSPVDSVVTNAERLLDRPVLGNADEELGVVTDVLLNQHGDAEHLVVTRLGFLGMVEHSVALPLYRLDLRGDGKAIFAPGITAAEIAGMPNFEYSDQVQSLYRAPRREPAP